MEASSPALLGGFGLIVDDDLLIVERRPAGQAVLSAVSLTSGRHATLTALDSHSLATVVTADGALGPAGTELACKKSANNDWSCK